MKDYVTLTFELVIAFLVPGAILAAGLSAVAPEIATQLLNESSNYTLLALLCISAGGGVFIAGLRNLTLDRILKIICRLPRLNFSALSNEATLKAYQAKSSDYWPYYCFYGGSAISLLFAYTLWRISGIQPFPGISWKGTTLGLCIAELILILSAICSFLYYFRAAEEILNVKRPDLEEGRQKESTTQSAVSGSGGASPESAGKEGGEGREKESGGKEASGGKNEGVKKEGDSQVEADKGASKSKKDK